MNKLRICSFYKKGVKCEIWFVRIVVINVKCVLVNYNFMLKCYGVIKC